jgi:general secretion pathway protein H
MPRSAPGNELIRCAGRRSARGFTLIELMVVVALIAIAAGVVSLSLNNPADAHLEREAARLTALLEAARTESRSLGIPVRWAPTPARDPGQGTESTGDQFRFEGLPEARQLPLRWLDPGVTAELPGGVPIVLGPEPLIAPQQIVLRLDGRSLALVTDGLGPFEIRARDAVGAR